MIYLFKYMGMSPVRHALRCTCRRARSAHIESGGSFCDYLETFLQRGRTGHVFDHGLLSVRSFAFPLFTCHVAGLFLLALQWNGRIRRNEKKTPQVGDLTLLVKDAIPVQRLTCDDRVFPHPVEEERVSIIVTEGVVETGIEEIQCSVGVFVAFITDCYPEYDMPTLLQYGLPADRLLVGVFQVYGARLERYDRPWFNRTSRYVTRTMLQDRRRFL